MVSTSSFIHPKYAGPTLSPKVIPLQQGLSREKNMGSAASSPTSAQCSVACEGADFKSSINGRRLRPPTRQPWPTLLDINRRFTSGVPPVPEPPQDLPFRERFGRQITTCTSSSAETAHSEATTSFFPLSRASIAVIWIKRLALHIFGAAQRVLAGPEVRRSPNVKHEY